MRSITAPLLLSSVVLLAACSHWPGSGGTTSTGAMAASCEVATVPHDAVYGARPGMDIATWPATAPRDGSGCQRVWYGQRSRPESMQVLSDVHRERMRAYTNRRKYLFHPGSGLPNRYCLSVYDAGAVTPKSLAS